MRRLLPLALAAFAVGAVALAADVKSGTQNTVSQPIGGVSSDGKVYPWLIDAAGRPTVLSRAADAGAEFGVTGPGGQPVATNPSATGGTFYADFCVGATYDGGLFWDGGTNGMAPAVYSVIYPTANTRSIKLANTNTTNSVSCVCGTQTPAIGAVGDFLAARGTGESSAPIPQSYDLTTTACSAVRCVSKTADQTSGNDGGTGCVRVVFAR